MNKVNNITPIEAWEILSSDLDSYLVDVRSKEEWNTAGIADLSSLNKISQNISWRLYPENTINPDFVNSLKKNIPNETRKLLFICRTGGRSLEAADFASKYGYTNCYNVINGFEGYNLGLHSQPGWKHYNLPWRQI